MCKWSPLLAAFALIKPIKLIKLIKPIKLIKLIKLTKLIKLIKLKKYLSYATQKDDFKQHRCRSFSPLACIMQQWYE